MRILIIESSLQQQKLAKRQLKKLENIEADFAFSLTEARIFLRTNDYCAAISEVYILSPETIQKWQYDFSPALDLAKELAEKNIHLVFLLDSSARDSRYLGFMFRPLKQIHNKNPYHFLTSGMLIEELRKKRKNQKMKKQWLAAFQYLILVYEFLQMPNIGEEIILKSGLSGFSNGDKGLLTEIFMEMKKNNPEIKRILDKYKA